MKSQFEDEVPEESDDSDDDQGMATTTTSYRPSFGGGKQLTRMVGRPGGGEKQMRYMPQRSDPESDNDDEEEDSDDDDEEEQPQPQQTFQYNRGFGGEGGQADLLPFERRRRGRGKRQ